MTDSIEIGDHKVQIKKRRGQRHLRLRISNHGNAILSTPMRFPNYLAKAYLKSKIEWLDAHTFQSSSIKNGSKLFTGQVILIKSESSSRNKLIICPNEMQFYLSSTADSLKSQKYIEDKVRRLYQQELSKIVEKRLEYYSAETQLSYKTFKIKNLRSKWGSCDRHKNLSFSLYLIGQELSLIDYTVLHELAHTKYMNHQSKFWSLVEEYMPDYKSRRSMLKNRKMKLV